MAGIAEEITASALSRRHASRTAPPTVDDGSEAVAEDKPPDWGAVQPLARNSSHHSATATSPLPALSGVGLTISGDTLAGTSAGIVGKVVEHPLDTVKTRLQERHARYSNPHAALVHILRCEGGSGLFKGISAPLAAAACEQGATFTLFTNALSAIERHRRQAVHTCIAGDAMAAREPPSTYSSEGRAAAPLHHHAVAGAATGGACATFVTPVEYLKCRMQQCCSRRVTMRELLTGGGWRHLFSGHTATLARDVPGTAAWFVSYECALRSFRLWDSRGTSAGTFSPNAPSDPSAARIAVAGGIAGVMFATAFFPADVVKTRMQLDREFCRRGLWRGLRTVVKEDGIRALFKGWSCTAVSAIPANAAVFLTYETVATYMERERRTM